MVKRHARRLKSPNRIKFHARNMISCTAFSGIKNMICSETLELPASEHTIMATKKPALAYLRTSSAANVGEEKDSRKRQMAAIDAYARRSGFEIVLPPYYDAVVSGADSIQERTEFPKMLAFLADHPNIHTIMVETPDRFARDLIVQETGYRMLRERGITLIPVSSPDHFVEETPTAVLVRQILGAISQFEKSMLVSKLRGARVRKKATGVKVEGRKSHAELHPEAVALARRLHRKPRNGTRTSLRDIAAALAAAGHVSSAGKPYSPSAIRSMLG
jgi:DNA invertase Pin-like site-specific DNA recombinase